MSAKLQQFQELAAQDQAESGIDMNEAVKGGGGGRLLPEGYAFGRLVEYVEFGMQPQEFGGKAKDPALEFTLGFALWGQGYQNDDGTPYIVRTYNTSLSRNEKSGAFKMFKALNWKGTAKSFAQLLGETFLVKIKHVPKNKTDPTIVSRIDLAGFLPPLDPVTRQPYPIPEASDALYRMFLWGHPTKEAWDSLYVEGQYEARDGKPAESKNRIQEQILAALDFQGSQLQQLLLASGVTTLPTVAALPAGPAVAPVAAPAAVVVPIDPHGPAAPTVAVPTVPTVPASVPAVTAPSVPVVADMPQPVMAAVPVVVPVMPAVASPALPA